MADEPTHTTVVEKSSGGTMLIGVVLLIAVLIGAFYLFSQNSSETRKNDAITEAARDVGGAAKDVGDAAQKSAPAN